MTTATRKTEKQVFGLDIGTRSIVGTVGYRDRDSFVVLAQVIREHETRAMLDGQIHDIGKVSDTIREVCVALEEQLGVKLDDVCIAAAGRVLKTQNEHVKMEFQRDTIITDEELYALTSLGVERAFEHFKNEEDSEERFYCVGHSVIRFYLNGNIIGNLEGHKAKSIEADLIATFLPDDVVDGLYRAVEGAGLHVVNLTLEPIAAIQVAIPEKFRMLNIALVDVGAGTSDVCITKDGSIVAYGMIPCAGDLLTETIAQHCLVEFGVAEQIKVEIAKKKTVTYEDIMCLPQSITREEVLKILDPQIKEMAQKVATCIKKTNGDKAVSAVFIVGGGGKIEGYTKYLAASLGIDRQRVALRGEEVMQKITFPADIKKDSLLVTPIGICLNYYEQSNNFIFVNFNGERIKLYDNSHLAVVDVAMQANFPTDGLFPKRGIALNYYVNQKPRITRGELGESAQILVNHEPADINTPIHANDIVQIIEATPGAPAKEVIEHLPEFKTSISLDINGKRIKLPKFATVNRKLQPGSYEIKKEDRIEFLDYYSVSQVLTFLDIKSSKSCEILVNNEPATLKTKVYENFSMVITFENKTSKNPVNTRHSTLKNIGAQSLDVAMNDAKGVRHQRQDQEPLYKMNSQSDEDTQQQIHSESKEEETQQAGVVEQQESTQQFPVDDEDTKETRTLTVIVNNQPVTMTGKAKYVYVDVFDFISFDLTKSEGRTIMTKLNGQDAQYMENLKQGDCIDIYWD